MPLKKINNLIYRLPYTIVPEAQQSIIDYAYTHAEWDRRAPSLFDTAQEYPKVFGRIQLRRPTADSIALIPDYTELKTSQLSYQYRYHPTVEWEWIDTPITKFVQQAFAQIEHLYTKVNRIFLLVQHPDHEIAAHADKFVNPHLDDYDLAVQSRVNHNMAIKFPLTETPGNNGRPYLYIDDCVYQYDVGNHAFAINEMDIMHGAMQSGLRRGVIFIDGFIDFARLEKEIHLPATLTKVPDAVIQKTTP
jgi:hypothetical protein